MRASTLARPLSRRLPASLAPPMRPATPTPMPTPMRHTTPTTPPTPTSTRASSTHAHLATALPARRFPLLKSTLARDQSEALEVSLEAFLAEGWGTRGRGGGAGATASTGAEAGAEAKVLPPAHHLVYFNPVLPADKLLPDGTDPLQSPGPPFVRRMWAGGYVRFRDPGDAGAVRLDGDVWCCQEGIRDVTVKGKEGEEKVFVGIERRVGKGGRLWEGEEERMGEAGVVERRNIVFMRERSPEELKRVVEAGKEKMLKPQNAPSFSHTLHPTPSLLFRYSALTFNAHAIHLDPHYCRTVEGHRDLLFHGPLSLTLLLVLLQNNIGKGTYIERIDYRNLAPLYCNEPVKLCGRKVAEEPVEKYELWAETPAGGVAVKGTAVVRKCGGGS